MAGRCSAAGDRQTLWEGQGYDRAQDGLRGCTVHQRVMMNDLGWSENDKRERAECPGKKVGVQLGYDPGE